MVVLGRPYCSNDRLVCLDLPRRLRNLGVLPIPMEMLPLDEVKLDGLEENYFLRFMKK